MQVARKAAPLLLLHLEEAPRERAQPLVRELELAVHALDRLLRAQALGDVVDHHEPRLAAAPAYEVRNAVDVERRAVLVLVPENAAVDRASGLIADEVATLAGPAQVAHAHAQEFVAVIAIEA